MKREEAINILSYHSGRNPDINNEKWRNGFLGMLKPYRGQLYEENFFEIMECLKSLQDEFNDDKICKELTANIYGITFYASMWTNKGGMLDNILNDTQKLLVKNWINIISYCFICLLEGNSEEAFSEYEVYVEEKNNI